MKCYSLKDKLLIGSIVFIIIGGIGVILKYLPDPKIWSTESATNDEIYDRQEIRNMITSLTMSLVGIVLSIVLIGVLNFNVASYQAFISLITLGLMSFIIANTIVTKNGVNIIQFGLDGTKDKISLGTVAESFKYSFGNIVDSKIIRYLIVTFFDIFVSIMLTDSFTWVFVKKFKLDVKLSEIFVIMFVGIITFIVFTNSFKLKWAFPNLDTLYSKSELLPTALVLVCVMFSSLIFLAWNPLILKKVGIISVQGKIIMLLALFILIIVGYASDSLDPVLEYEITDKIVNSSSEVSIEYNKVPTVKELYDNGNYGVLIYFLIVLTCMATTIYTSKNIKIDTKFVVLVGFILLFVNIPSIISFF